MNRRWSSGGRGVVIAALIGLYGWFTKEPTGSLAVSLLFAAGVQIAVIVIRRLVPADRLPEAMSVFEVVADGVTVLLFALGVFGGIARMAEVP